MVAAGTAAVITPIRSFEGNGYAQTVEDGLPGRRTMAIRQHILDVQFGQLPDSGTGCTGWDSARRSGAHRQPGWLSSAG